MRWLKVVDGDRRLRSDKDTKDNPSMFVAAVVNLVDLERDLSYILRGRIESAVFV